MNVLYYTNKERLDDTSVTDIIKSYGDKIFIFTEKLNVEILNENKIDFVVSDRSRYLINKDILDEYYRKIINIHPSFLPWGKGYHPNYWSLKEGSPWGVTIHFIDQNIDTGDIIAQIRMTPNKNDTLRSSYIRLRNASVHLFKYTWSEIKNGNINGFKQNQNDGSLHFRKDFEGILENLPNGWDTPINFINDKYK